VLLVDDDGAISGLTMRAAGAAQARLMLATGLSGTEAEVRLREKAIGLNSLDDTHTARAAELHEPATAGTAIAQIPELLADAQRIAGGDLDRSLGIEG
jgi:hypothetical protein